MVIYLFLLIVFFCTIGLVVNIFKSFLFIDQVRYNLGYKSIFNATLEGFFLSVFFFAVLKTGGKTSLWVVPLYLFSPINLTRNSVKKNSNNRLFYVIGIILILVLYSSYYLNYNWEYQKIIGESDLFFYVESALVMSKTGVETTMLNPIFDMPYVQNIYHYIDLWTISLFKEITNQNLYKNYFSLFSLFFMILSALGLAVKMIDRGYRVFYIIFLSIAAVTYVSVFPYRDGGWIFSIFFTPKIAPLILWSIYAFVNSESWIEYLNKSFLICFLNPLIFPVWSVMMLIYLINDRFYLFNNFKKIYLTHFMAFCTFCIYYFVFAQKGFDSTSTLNIQSQFFDLAYIKKFFYLLFRVNLIRFLFFNPVFVIFGLILYLRFKRNIFSNSFIAMICLTFLFSFIVADLFHFYYDFYQITNITIAVIFPIFIYCVFDILNKERSSLSIAFLSFLLVLNSINIYSRRTSIHNEFFSKNTESKIEKAKIFGKDNFFNYCMINVDNPRLLPFINYERSRYIKSINDNLIFLTFNNICNIDSVYLKNYFYLFKYYPSCIIRDSLNNPHDSVLMDVLIKDYNFSYYISMVKYPQWIDRRFEQKFYDSTENLTILYDPKINY